MSTNNMNISQEYVGAIVIFAVSILKVFGVEIENDVISGLVVGAIALWVAIRRKMKGDIDGLGRKLQ